MVPRKTEGKLASPKQNQAARGKKRQSLKRHIQILKIKRQNKNIHLVREVKANGKGIQVDSLKA